MRSITRRSKVRLFTHVSALTGGLLGDLLRSWRPAPFFEFRFWRLDREDSATRGLRNLRQSVRENFHDRSQRHLSIESGHIARLHANAAVAGRPANQLFFGRAVNVNTPAKGVRV